MNSLLLYVKHFGQWELFVIVISEQITLEILFYKNAFSLVEIDYKVKLFNSLIWNRFLFFVASRKILLSVEIISQNF